MKHLDDYLSRIEARDEVAFQELYQETKNGVYAIIMSIVKNRQTTEDLMQDTYIRMLEKLHLYERGRNFQAWLIQIAKNIAYDYIRKSSKQVVLDPIESGYVFDQTIPTEPASDSPNLMEMIACLDATESEIILLKVVNDLPFREIATVVNKPLGTVLWLYQRALKKMKKHLEGGVSHEK